MVSRIKIFLYLFLLNKGRILLPDSFFADIREQRTRNPFLFFIFIRLIIANAWILNKLKAEDAALRKLIQGEKLKSVFAAALKTAWWAPKINSLDKELSLLDDSFSLLHKLSPTTRSLLSNENFALLSSYSLPPSLKSETRTSGSSGTPLAWSFDRRTLFFESLSHPVALWESIGVPFQKCAWYDFSIQFNFHRWASMSSIFTQNIFIDKEKAAAEHTLTEFIKRLPEKYYTIRANPSELLFLAETIEKHKIIHPFVMASAIGQKVLPEVYEKIKKGMGIPVTLSYGTQETSSPVARACAHDPSKYHVVMERCIVEILDDAGTPVPDGTVGNITITCLDNLFMPLLRYQPGDKGCLSAKECECDDTAPCLEIEGRIYEYIAFTDGTKVSAVAIERFFLKDPYFEYVKKFQATQISPAVLSVAVEPRASVIPAEKLNEMAEKLEDVFRKKISIQITPVEHIPQEGAKFKNFIPL